MALEHLVVIRFRKSHAAKFIELTTLPRRTSLKDMLCEKCQDREANVHKTFIDNAKTPHARTEQHLCEICAGTKTEEQLKEEQRARWEQNKIEREKVAEESRFAMEEIERSLFKDRRQIWRSNKCGVFCWSVDPRCKFAIALVGSTLPD